MTYNETARTARTPARRARSATLAALAVVGATLMGVIGCQSSASSPSSTAMSSPAASPSDSRHGNRPGALGEAGGVVSDGVTVFDGEVPAVANLDPDLLDALRRAAKEAADDEVTFFVNSGWRSPEYQDQLLREAVAKYGSKEEAARWVATADTSPHVSGNAIDVGQSDATAWLSGHGADHGLCQIYRNESWHYELRPEAIDQGCPPMYADPTQDPRMQR
ncbi:M15 family metallopeptidase [Streptomyces sp. BA2]|uniref:M15 family metallopeptidase n=1 Tax=Streptomyces sp. BA2 TaxID=436595 RepID=UPI003FA7970A